MAEEVRVTGFYGLEKYMGIMLMWASPLRTASKAPWLKDPCRKPRRQSDEADKEWRRDTGNCPQKRNAEVARAGLIAWTEGDKAGRGRDLEGDAHEGIEVLVAVSAVCVLLDRCDASRPYKAEEVGRYQSISACCVQSDKPGGKVIPCIR